MLQQEFDQWMNEVKKAAMEDYGYSQNEANNFIHKCWKEYYEMGFTPFEAILQYLKTAFSHQNK